MQGHLPHNSSPEADIHIALVHDWFRVNAGSEKVVSEIIALYKKEEIQVFTLFNYLAKNCQDEILQQKPVKPSVLQHIPTVSRNYRYLLPLMPFLMKQFYIKGVNVILSSSHAVAKGFRRDKTIPHICYCHTPMRYIWDLYEDYKEDSHSLKSLLHKAFVRYLRRWDLRTASNVDYFIANSDNVKQRIATHYKREAVVIYPPVRTDKFQLSVAPRKEYYLSVGRLVPYKKIDVIISAFKKMPDKHLILIGDGYDSGKIRKMVKDYPNILWLGYRNDEDLVKYMQQAKACLFAAKEDFGIMCVEAQACGTPVIALNNGGYKETVVEGKTGYFFDKQTEESIIAAVLKHESKPLTDHTAIRAHAEKFSSDRFRREFATFVSSCMKDFHKKNH